MSHITIPGLIDVHVHLRDPGQTHKEDFHTGTAAALAGGFTMLLDMPNNAKPITSLLKLEEKVAIAQKKIVCDLGFYFGSLGDNIDEFSEIYDKVWGIKLYLNPTTGNYLVNDAILEKVYLNWQNRQPILVHAEADVIDTVIQAVEKFRKATHICHVSSRTELQSIITAKEKGLPVTCGVTPHHLFLSHSDERKFGAWVKMKPSLKTENDRQFLWDNLQYVDVIESDHAPHTKEEKLSDSPPFGVPGLETTLPLLLTAASEGKLTMEQIIELCHDNPRKIFNLPQQDAKVEIDMNESYEIINEGLKTKCGWTPFEGWKVKGRVKSVYLRGEKVFDDGRILIKGGYGNVLYPE